MSKGYVRRLARLGGALLSGLLGLLGGLHVYWALGGRWGWEVVLPTQGGERLLDPSPPLTVGVALGLFGAAAAVLGRLGLWGDRLPPGLFRWGTRLLSLAFALRGLGDGRTVGLSKTIRDTPFARWDTRLFTPLCLLMAALGLLTERAAPPESS